MGILRTEKKQMMNSLGEVTEYIDIDQLKHVKIHYANNEYSVSLVDSAEYEIVKGYGTTILEAINDLHAGLV
jgi:hypothetical protein